MAVLEAKDITEEVATVEIIEAKFTPEGESKEIAYNQLKVTLSNGRSFLVSVKGQPKMELEFLLNS